MLKALFVLATIPTEMSCPHPRIRSSPRTIPRPDGLGGAQVWCVKTSVMVVVPLNAIALNPQELPCDEQAYAARIQHRQTKHNFLVGRTLLRQWLSQVTGHPTDSLTLGTGPHGKPFLVEDPSLQFNLSHGGDRLAMVLSDGQAVGIDLEPIQPRRRLPQLCRRYLSPRETQQVLALPPDQSHAQFLRYWTCKEAYVKGLGVGLTIPLNAVELSLSLGPQPTEPHPIASAQGLEPGWQLYQWQPTPGCAAALAVHE